MKIMIASDIHGSSFYCQKMITAFKNEQADTLLLLGDILYHGPRNDLPKDYSPKQVVQMLNAIKDKILCVRGNCDCEVDQMVLDFPIEAPYCILYVDKKKIFATHGHLYSPDSPPPLSNGDILLCGHTHIPEKREHNGFFYLNPGSVSIPKANSQNSYMTLTDGIFEWKTLDGEVIKI